MIVVVLNFPSMYKHNGEYCALNMTIVDYRLQCFRVKETLLYVDLVDFSIQSEVNHLYLWNDVMTIKNKKVVVAWVVEWLL